VSFQWVRADSNKKFPLISLCEMGGSNPRFVASPRREVASDPAMQNL
jgi:hypothetical protein